MVRTESPTVRKFTQHFKTKCSQNEQSQIWVSANRRCSKNEQLQNRAVLSQQWDLFDRVRNSSTIKHLRRISITAKPRDNPCAICGEPAFSKQKRPHETHPSRIFFSMVSSKLSGRMAKEAITLPKGEKKQFSSHLTTICHMSTLACSILQWIVLFSIPFPLFP